MKTIYGGLIGLVTGFVTAILMTPNSGKETRKDIRKSVNEQAKNAKSGYEELALRLGLLSKQKRAELNKQKVKAQNKKINKNTVDPTVRDEKELQRYHENNAGDKVINSDTAKAKYKV